MKHALFRLKAWRLTASFLAVSTGTHAAPLAVSDKQPDGKAQVPYVLYRKDKIDSHPTGVDSVFRTRWRGSDTEFVVDRSGRIQIAPARASESRTRTASNDSASNTSQIDFVLGNRKTNCDRSTLTPSHIAELVAAAAQRYGIDPEFALAIATTQRRLDSEPKSPSAMHGPSGRAPSNAAAFDLGDACDPAQHIDSDVRRLKSLFETYRNPLIVAAAFQAGEANVRKYGGIPPFAESIRFVTDVINWQLGLPAVAPKDANSGPDTEPSPTDNNQAAGVLTTGKSRQWVGGVLQF